MAKKITKIVLIIALFLLINYSFIQNFSYKVVADIKLKELNGLNKIGEEYFGILEIPKINLKKGFYSLNSKYNHVKYGLEILKDDPNLLIVASHSGNSLISYFKNLDKLVIGDEVIITKNASKDIYEVKYFYSYNKNGMLEMLNDHLTSKIILITCDKNDLAKELVYVASKKD